MVYVASDQTLNELMLPERGSGRVTSDLRVLQAGEGLRLASLPQKRRQREAPRELSQEAPPSRDQLTPCFRVITLMITSLSVEWFSLFIHTHFIFFLCILMASSSMSH